MMAGGMQRDAADLYFIKRAAAPRAGCRHHGLLFDKQNP